MRNECAFREHPAEVNSRLSDKPGVALWQFECEICAATYIVSDDLLVHHAVLLKRDGTGDILSRLAKRLSAQGDLLKLITEGDVTAHVQDQTRFEHPEHPSKAKDRPSDG